MNINFTINHVTEPEDLEEVVKLQESVWGKMSIVPVGHLIASIHNGGVVLSAIEQGSGKVVGFCYGFAGFDKGNNPYIYSHMLAVLPDYQNFGIGRQLKLEQKKWAIKYGYNMMKWTFDPLEIRNGYLNLCKLGGTVSTYIPEFYGVMKDKVNKGLLSDRLLLEWDLNPDQKKDVIQAPWKTYRPLLDWTDSNGEPKPGQRYKIQNDAGYLVAIPKDIQTIKETNLVLLNEWRLTTRQVLMSAFKAGYRLVGVERSDTIVYHYVLEK